MGHRPIARMRPIAWLLAAASVGSLAVPAAASATIRFAAPGGTASDAACLTDTGPACSIGTAAGGPDVTGADEAVILPGHYSDADLDGDANLPTDHSVRVTAGSVHGQFGDRPVITAVSDLGPGAFVVNSGTTLSSVEIDAADSARDITVLGGVIDGVVARTSRGGSFACNVGGGSLAVIRDSFCFSDGVDSVALGSSLLSSTGTHTVRLRHVTAVATAPDSDGLFFQARGGGVNLSVDATSVIAGGGLSDVRAQGLSNADPPLPNTGGNVSIALDHSNYAATATRTDTGGGTATITPAGSGTNQLADPLLAGDGYHELAGSPTLEHGAVDTVSGTMDVDGQNRAIGQAPDIGADEKAFPTTTALSCAPNPLLFGPSSAHCDVAVTDTSSPPPVTLDSGIRPRSDLPGTISNGCEVLGMTTPTQGTCSFDYRPGVAGMHRITATFPGDAFHDASEASDVLDVTVPRHAKPSARRAKCKKKKRHHRASTAKKKCKKKKRR
jgi:hypothetical protein